jgi:hypothetical protein
METAASNRPKHLKVGFVTRRLALGKYLIPTGLHVGHRSSKHIRDVVHVLGIPRRFPHLEFERGHETPSLS